MKKYYTAERNAQVVLALLKEHGINRVIASPGTTNMALVASMQSDPYFKMYSCVDERSAAYMACGLAAELGEPVVISCTGATASRNYLPGLTEAYYRKLPVLAITSMPSVSKVGHHIAQIIDRSTLPKDVAKLSVTLPIIKDDEDLWDCEIKVNKAILELRRNGGGPAHINLPTIYSKSYDVQTLPNVRVVRRIELGNEFPRLPKGKVGVFIGAHAIFDDEATRVIDEFCYANNAVVFCDHTSNYHGRFRVLFSLVAGQMMDDFSDSKPDLLIHIGEVTGDYYSLGLVGNQVWRVSEDGEIRDTFRKLNYVFEIPEITFFEHYAKNGLGGNRDSYFQSCLSRKRNLEAKISELPFSNIWVASVMAQKIPEHATIHFGILNSLRSWNFFDLPKSVHASSNVGGFGIDGSLSTLIGASLANEKKLFFLVIGDLSFFYDMNSLGNRHIGGNLRVLLINNGKGTEFRQYNHFAAQHGDSADEFIAAAGHFGQKSPVLVRNYVEALGFNYMAASNKQMFYEVFDKFLGLNMDEVPMVFEVFTKSEDESYALESVLSLEKSFKAKVKQVGGDFIGEKSKSALKRIIGR